MKVLLTPYVLSCGKAFLQGYVGALAAGIPTLCAAGHSSIATWVGLAVASLAPALVCLHNRLADKPTQ